MATLATAADMLKRYDARMVGDLVGDSGVRVEGPDLLAHPNLDAALDDAWGEIIAALKRGNRYTQADLDSLTGESKQFLIRVCCKIALRNLHQRRRWSEQDEQREVATSEAQKAIAQLASGERVLDIEDVKQAGVPTIHVPTVSSIKRANLVVDRARQGFYPAREFARQ